MTPGNIIVSSEQFWISGFVVTLIDVAFVWLLTWRIKPLRFRQLRWVLVGAAALFWSVFAIVLVRSFWDTYYQYFFPTWLRSGGTLLYVPLLYGILAFSFHWLALRLPANPVVAFCLLGGITSILEHLWGIYGLGILEAPILREASPISVLFFAFPEYVLYWCAVISMAIFIQNSWHWLAELLHRRELAGKM